jgi:hypothetical protein
MSKTKLHLKLFDESVHLNSLYILLKEFQIEVFKEEQTQLQIKNFIDSHTAGIYIVFSGTSAIGFTAFNKNEYFGLRKPTIANTYLYIKPKYRRTKAMHLISIQAGKVAIGHDCNLEHYYAKDSGSVKFIGRMKGELVYNAYEYPLEVVSSEIDELQKKVKVV